MENFRKYKDFYFDKNCLNNCILKYKDLDIKFCKCRICDKFTRIDFLNKVKVLGKVYDQVRDNNTEDFRTIKEYDEWYEVLVCNECMFGQALLPYVNK